MDQMDIPREKGGFYANLASSPEAKGQQPAHRNLGSTVPHVRFTVEGNVTVEYRVG